MTLQIYGSELTYEVRGAMDIVDARVQADGQVCQFGNFFHSPLYSTKSIIRTISKNNATEERTCATNLQPLQAYLSHRNTVHPPVIHQPCMCMFFLKIIQPAGIIMRLKTFEKNGKAWKSCSAEKWPDRRISHRNAPLHRIIFIPFSLAPILLL